MPRRPADTPLCLSSLSKYSRRRRPAAALVVTLAGLALPATAETLRDTERFERKRVSAGEEVDYTVDCPRGHSVTGGGYALYNLPDDRVLFMVTANYPLDDGWRVEVRNVSQTAQPLALRVYALCIN